jgi:alpha-amylase/alpha-mannosidase (GH57 family)
MKQRDLRSQIFLAFCIAAPLTGCTDLSAVRKWSSTSLEAAQYNQLITTYVDTPQRLKRYSSLPQLDETSVSRKKQAEALKEILLVVTDYMAALATLSADSTVDYSKQEAALKSSITALNGKINSGNQKVSEQQLSAAGTIITTLLNTAAKAYQAKQVSLIVEQANQPLQSLLAKDGFLYQVVDLDFRRDLVTEQTAIDIFYSNLSDNRNRAAHEAVEDWKEVRNSDNAKRLQAVDAYLKVLDKIAEGHQALYKNRGSLDSAALIKQLEQLIVELRKQIQILAQA